MKKWIKSDTLKVVNSLDINDFTNIELFGSDKIFENIDECFKYLIDKGHFKIVDISVIIGYSSKNDDSNIEIVFHLNTIENMSKYVFYIRYPNDKFLLKNKFSIYEWKSLFIEDKNIYIKIITKYESLVREYKIDKLSI